jgi:hypothetical protein
VTELAEARDYPSRTLELFERLSTPIEPEKVRPELAALPGRVAPHEVSIMRTAAAGRCLSAGAKSSLK